MKSSAPTGWTLDTQLKIILERHLDDAPDVLVKDLMSLLESLVDDAYIAGKRAKSPPLIQ